MNKEIFNIIDEFFQGIDNPKSYELEDATYISFFEKYLAFAMQRDIALRNYLNSNEKKHRTFIPFKDGFLGTLKETFWYYDELIVVDPIVYAFVKFHQKGRIDEKELEESKHFLKYLLREISELRGLIDEDYILFDSSRFMDDTTKTELAANISIANILSKRIDFTRLLDADMRIMKGMVTNGDRKQKAFEIHYKRSPHHYINTLPGEKFQIKFHQQHPGLLSSMFLHPQKATKKEIDKKFPLAVKEVRSKFYPNEIKLIIDSISQSTSLNCPVFFNNSLEEQVHKCFCDTSVFKGIQADNHKFIKIIAPYLSGVESKDLLELREKMPDSFLHFRQELNKMISEELILNPEITSQLLQETIEERLSVELKHFEQDIRSVHKSVLKSAIPLIIGIGTLQFGSFPLIVNTVAAGLTGAGSLNAFNKIQDALELKNNNEKRPLYYLWKAKNKN